jgi:hypothetical protein
MFPFKVIAFLLSALSFAESAPSTCGRTTQPPAELLAVAGDRMALTRMKSLRTEAVLEFPIAFHIIHTSDNKGKISEQACRDQVDVLNEAYAGSTAATGLDSGLRFTFDSIEYIQNDRWFGNQCVNKDLVFKQKHNKDTSKYINFYTCSGSGYLGWSTIPMDGPDEMDASHAVVVAYNSLPSQGLTSYDEGDTGVHEIGHFLGLLHTFSNGQCNENSGDGVADTPLQKSASSGCPTNRDSCPSSAGLDPTDNFMDYTDDGCMDKFTRGQVDRMRRSIKTYKPKLAANSHVGEGTTTTIKTTTTTTTTAETTAASTAPVTTTTNTMPDTKATTQAPSTEPNPSTEPEASSVGQKSTWDENLEPTGAFSTAAFGTTSEDMAGCNERQWMCASGKECIRKGWHCDGISDCTDGSDETLTECSGDPGLPTVECADAQFACHNGEQCISRGWKCDGISDCFDGSDEAEQECLLDGPTRRDVSQEQEASCKPNEWVCSSGTQCIPQEFLCDGIVDCDDHSDEGPGYERCQDPSVHNLFAGSHDRHQSRNLLTVETVSSAGATSSRSPLALLLAAMAAACALI